MVSLDLFCFDFNVLYSFQMACRALYYTLPLCLQRLLLAVTVSYHFLLVMSWMILVSAGRGFCRMSTAGILGSFVNVDVQMDEQHSGIFARLQTASVAYDCGCWLWSMVQVIFSFFFVNSWCLTASNGTVTFYSIIWWKKNL